MQNIMINPVNDGITHINIYSKGVTELGRMLSNFFHFQFKCDDGVFESIEGYYYWLHLPHVVSTDILHNVYGWKAKKIGRELSSYLPQCLDENWQQKILQSVGIKMFEHIPLFLEEYDTLPYTHYYLYNDKIIDASSGQEWWLAGIDAFREVIVKIR